MRINLFQLSSIICILFLLASCSVYYKTSDIEPKLKTMVTHVNSNCSVIQLKMEKVQMDFMSLNCESEFSTVKKANQLLSDLVKTLQDLNSIKTLVNSEYANFIQYTRGKTQIQSNSNEWSQFKQTKKVMKQSLKDFDKKGKLITAIASDFSRFISREFSNVEFLDVQITSKKFNQMILDLVKTEKDLTEKLKNQENQIVEIISKKARTNEGQCKQLNEDLYKVIEEKKKFNTSKQKIIQTINDFNNKIQGLNRIYSCSKDWEYIKSTENNLTKAQEELNVIIKNLERIHKHMQDVITSIN